MKKLLVLLAIAIILPLNAQRVLFIGDSVTDGGWGRSSGQSLPSDKRNHKDLNHIYGHSYMIMCASHYESLYPEAGYEFFNRGISGDDLSRIEARWTTDALALRPDVLSLLVGINDVYYHTKEHSADDFDYDGWERRYRALLDSARLANPDLTIMLGTPFIAQVGKNGAAANYADCETMTHRLAEIVRRIANDYGAAVVSYDKMFDEQKEAHPAVAMSHWIWDGVHPTAAGHRLMANEWIATFDKIGHK